MKKVDSLHGWVTQRCWGSPRTVPRPQSVVSRQLYSVLECVQTWDPTSTDCHRHHGSIFNFDFSSDGSVLVAACERNSLLMFDPNNGKLIGAKDNAHSDSVNCIRFLDTRMFATCSDDQTVCLWDLRNMSQKIHTLRGHTNLVKNIEYIPSRGVLISSAFDGCVNTWNINSYTEESFTTHKRVLFLETLMRCRVLADGTKLVASTADGYLLLIHDLDLDRLAEDLGAFNPSLYRDLIAGSSRSFPRLDRCRRLFTAKRNRVELITDFPWPESPGMIPSLELHPHGWCVVSRSLDLTESCETTCVHDIQGSADDVQLTPITVSPENRDSLRRTRPTRPRIVPLVHNGDVVFLPFRSAERSDSFGLPMSQSGDPDDVPNFLVSALLGFHGDAEEENEVERRDGEAAEVNSASSDTESGDNDSPRRRRDYPEPDWDSLPRDNPTDDRELLPQLNPVDNETLSFHGRVSQSDPETPSSTTLRENDRSSSPNRDVDNSFSPSTRLANSDPVRPQQSDLFSLGDDDLLYNSSPRQRRRQRWSFSPRANAADAKTTSPAQHLISRPVRRLLYHISEPNVGHGYIKEIAFGAGGRVIASPFGFGVRILAFNSDCGELCDCAAAAGSGGSMQQPSVLLREVVTNVCHGSVVVTTRFSPDSSLLVTGSLSGKVGFHRPRW